MPSTCKAGRLSSTSLAKTVQSTAAPQQGMPLGPQSWLGARKLRYPGKILIKSLKMAMFWGTMTDISKGCQCKLSIILVTKWFVPLFFGSVGKLPNIPFSRDHALARFSFFVGGNMILKQKQYILAMETGCFGARKCLSFSSISRW